MIPTIYKEKIPKMLSYPIGAEALSIALAGTPQIEHLSIYFYGDFKIDKTKEIKKTYSILEVEYTFDFPDRNAPNKWIASGYYSPKWKITVNAVPCELKSEVRNLLEIKAFPQLTKWMLDNQKIHGRHENAAIVFKFDESAGELQINVAQWR